MELLVEDFPEEGVHQEADSLEEVAHPEEAEVQGAFNL